MLCSTGLGEIAFAALLGRAPGENDLFAFPDAGRAAAHQWAGRDFGPGAKGRFHPTSGAARACAAQQGPHRLPVAHRLRHGGNGYEGIAYLCEQFRATGLRDPAPMITASICRRWQDGRAK